MNNDIDVVVAQCEIDFFLFENWWVAFNDKTHIPKNRIHLIGNWYFYQFWK